MQIQVTRIRIDKVTERGPAAAASKRIEDATLNMSRQVVEDPGTPGTQDVTFAIARVNGVETGRLPVANVVLIPALTRYCGWVRSPAPRCRRWATGHLGRACAMRSRR